MKNQKIDTVMTTKVITIMPEESLQDALVLMAEQNVSCVVLATESVPLGLLSEEKVISMIAEGTDPSKKLEEFAVPIPHSLSPDQTLVEAVIAMEKGGLGLVVVTDEQVELVGILTVSDIIDKLDDHDFTARQKVKYSMTKKLVMVGEMDTVSDCIRKMADQLIDCVIVTAQKKGVGIFTRRDAVKAVYDCCNGNRGHCTAMQEGSSEQCNITDPVYRHMTPSLITITPEAFLFDACKLMGKNHVRRVVVTDAKDHPRGIVTQREVLKRLDANYTELISKTINQSGSVITMEEASFSAMLEWAFEPALIQRDDKIVDVNLQMLDRLGLKKSELIGKNIFDFAKGNQSVDVKAEVKKRFEGKSLSQTFPLNIKDLGNSPLLLECRAKNFGISSGVSRTWFVARDISRWSDNSEELLRLKEKAEKASQAKAAFIANMSHELRTPLTAIIGFGKLINDNSELCKEAKSHGSVIVRQGKNLLSMINKILELSQVEKNRNEDDYQKVAIKAVLDKVATSVKELAELQEVTLKVEVDQKLPKMVLIDLEKVSTALLEILNNGVKFSNGGGTVILSASLSGSMLRFSVADEGIGIDESDFEKIFKKFVQIDDSISREYCGAGLGLSLVKTMTHAMGGKVWLESKKGHGSRFFIEVPFKAD